MTMLNRCNRPDLALRQHQPHFGGEGADYMDRVAFVGALQALAIDSNMSKCGQAPPNLGGEASSKAFGSSGRNIQLSVS